MRSILAVVVLASGLTWSPAYAQPIPASPSTAGNMRLMPKGTVLFFDTLSPPSFPGWESCGKFKFDPAPGEGKNGTQEFSCIHKVN